MDEKGVVYDFDHVKLEPIASENRYVFVSLTEPRIELIMASLSTFKEAEGVSLVIDRNQADRENLIYDNVYGLISIGIYSSLDAVGLTAKISTALAAEKIPCNIIAAYHHDHILVPESLIERALEIIVELS